jgi:virginiamycin A acetyltransferase
VLRGIYPIEIGQFCAIGRNLLVISHNHRMTSANLQVQLHESLRDGDGAKGDFFEGGPVRIGNNVWIGDHVTILTGVSIGDGAVIGARAVVTRDIPAFAVAVGVPAAVKRFRFTPEMMAFLRDLAWWDWPMERIQRNASFLRADLVRLSVDEAKAALFQD